MKKKKFKSWAEIRDERKARYKALLEAGNAPQIVIFAAKASLNSATVKAYWYNDEVPMVDY